MAGMMGRGRASIKARGTGGAIAAVAAFASAAAAAAFAASATEPPPATLRLVAGVPLEGGGRLAGLEFAMAAGWKTYWRNPGDAGVPPVFDWSGSRNLAAVTVEWPAPELFDSFGFATLGYADIATLPLRVTPADPARPVALRLALDYGVCADICIADRAELALTIAPDARAEGAAAIAAALGALPTPAREAGVLSAECGLTGSGAAREFAATLRFDAPPPAPAHAVVEGPDTLWIGPVAVAVDGAAMALSAEAQLADPAAWVARDAFRITLLGAGLGAAGAVEVAGCAS